ncbi:MAG: NTP transferase domain-containing protein [Ignavibacteriae bacterium]|nr:NTP transferase domain-containing protein [Ignavibacteriota bacterium]
MKNTSVLILAGGESSRIKRSKAFLNFDGCTTFLEKITKEYIAVGINNIVLVINAVSLTSENKKILSRQEKKLIIIDNENPEEGRLHSLKLGLSFF